MMDYILIKKRTSHARDRSLQTCDEALRASDIAPQPIIFESRNNVPLTLAASSFAAKATETAAAESRENAAP
ncbi:hypothetical protein D3C80_2096420 [compost metagenome]